MTDADQLDIKIITLRTAEQRQQAAALYRSVFGYDHPAYGVNPRLLAGLSSNGGSVIGALDNNDRLVGFTFGFLGTDQLSTYHYSQAAVVATDLQGQGLGRQLKLAQREVALRSGVTSMRWAYDPLLTRNAHFNLDVLGARGIAFYPDLYDEPGTDRVLINWDLDDLPASVRTGTAAAAVDHGEADLPTEESAVWGRPITDGDRLLLPVPARIDHLREHRPRAAADIAQAVGEFFTEAFDDGYQAVSCRAVGSTAFYVLKQFDEV
ncbi:GNAT family N-acetyltransferase [Microlunatus elymi]|uniref:GNAT family N-acetyltransferase n=1 Tax=Microlunatus elymi TaxID=2596828 RepID=A0A516Q138_9ACTN|nr:GNAT family N-acetyltransferase [Microlunatus elymi]QDP97118.1 GNAT family N-acetyltransferase [Microlunatus elymi]